MNCYNLIPFDVDLSPNIEPTVTVNYQFPNLFLTYKIIDELQQIKFPKKKESPQRQDELWQHTCFEFFLASVAESSYWEFNLSPNHDWNCYRFSNYRQGMVTETAWQASPLEIQNLNDQDRGIDIGINLQALIPQKKTLQLGISTVVETHTGQVSYWALNHPGPTADFHQRNSWSINLF